MRLYSDDIINDFVHGGKIYLNNASVSLMPARSVDAMREFLVQYNSAGPDSASSEPLVAERFGNVRRIVSKIINSGPDEVVVTQSVTDGINLVANGIRVGPGSEIVIRGMSHEHHANLYPWLRLGRRCGLTSIPIRGDGSFRMDDLSGAVGPNTRVVALSHALYNTGTILPAGGVGGVLREQRIPYFVDAAQTVGCTDIVDVEKIGCDFMSFNGSKWLCGPMGTGIFYCRRRSSELLEPAAVGGESATLHEKDGLVYRDMPDRFQAGFRNYAGLAGLESSAGYLLGLGLGNIRKKIIGLANLLRGELQKIPGTVLYGPDSQEDRTSIVSFSIGGLEPDLVVAKLEKDGVVLAVREIVDQKIIRASPHLFNSEQDMLRVVELLKRLL